MTKLITIFLSLNFIIAFPVYSMEEPEMILPIQATNLVLAEVSPDKRSALITLKEESPINISFNSQQGLTFENRQIPTRLTSPEILEKEITVQQGIESYYTQAEENNIVINLIMVRFLQNYGKEVYCQDFKGGKRNNFTNTYHLIKNEGYGHFNNHQAYNNVVLCFADSQCKLTLAPSCQPIGLPRAENLAINMLLGIADSLLSNHQKGDAFDNTVEKGAVFHSLELTPAQEGFSSGWIQGEVDFKKGIFNLTLQRLKLKINLEPTANYKFL